MDPVVAAVAVVAALIVLGLIVKLLGLAAKTVFLLALVGAGVVGYFLVIAPSS